MCCAVLCGRVLAGDSDDDDCVRDGARYDDPSHPEPEAPSERGTNVGGARMSARDMNDRVRDVTATPGRPNAAAGAGSTPAGPNAATPAMSKGAAAERLVVDRLRAVLRPDVAILHGVRWLSRDHGHVREGEADVVIGDPDRGILVIEVKAGEVRRDGPGRWHVGTTSLPRSPFEQAADSRHALVRKLSESPGWTAGLDPIAGQAVAFPNVELDSMRGRLGLLGPDVDVDLIADQSTFVDDDTW